ncbi:MAG: extracellular solute-binding protein [Chloroflexota bacterium]
MRACYTVLALLALCLASCTGVPLSQNTPALGSTPQQTATIPATAAELGTPTTTPITSGPVTLRLWVPPQFDPAAGTPAGNLLQARLNEFSQRRPGVYVEVRVKAVSGPGGLLDSLSTTSTAAPLVMPDVVALPRNLLEAAALKGLLHPYDGLTNVLDSADWYGYASNLGRLQNSVFGLPFAGDALTLVYRAQVVETPPVDWLSVATLKHPLVFPAADPQALVTLAFYQANAGEIQDEQFRPYLDATALNDVMDLFMQCEQSGVMPYWLTQYLEDGQVWEAYTEGRADLVITWTSRYLQELPEETLLAPLPVPDVELSEPFTLATGWVWALASPREERRGLSVELAEFLSQPSFLAVWSEAGGYLPVRPSALGMWTNTDLRTAISPVVLSAHLLPPNEILPVLGEALEQATVQVLKAQSEPIEAARTAVQSVNAP